VLFIALRDRYAMSRGSVYSHALGALKVGLNYNNFLRVSVTIPGKNSIYEVHSIVPTGIYQPIEDNFMSEKSISGVKKYKHFHRRHLKFLRPV
jgi:hypothetical protein